jgi:hypothetical protein
LAADIAADTPQLSTIPIGSFAGIALTLLPWYCPAARSICIMVLIPMHSLHSAARSAMAE